VRVLLAALLAMLCLGAPAGLAAGTSAPRQLGPFGKGGDRYWLWQAHGKPKAVVVFLHGLDTHELTPANHVPWIEHLVRKGDAVVYPRYERQPGTFGALRHTLVAVNAGLARLHRPKVPLVVVGYSRGGRLAVEFAAVAAAIRVVPKAVMSIFPSRLNPVEEEVVDLRGVSPATRIMLVVGQEDSRDGARELLGRLAQAGFPANRLQAVLVHSRGTFHADHFSALRTGPEVRRQLWAPLDRLVAKAH
jgi:poly(3-hydroxybutyrate) depolymerase